MLDLDPARAGVTPKDAATLVVVRDGVAGLEVFCVERQRVGFLGGAIVFPGGKLDPSDRDPAWSTLATDPRDGSTPLAATADDARALAVAACRESLEEAAILPLAGAVLSHPQLLDWRRALAAKEATLAALVAGRGAKLDLGALVPMARWLTPEAEARRYDTRFYLYVAGGAVEGAHDDHETTASFWATPRDVLRRFDAGELQLAPPTHRTLEILAAAPGAEDARRLAGEACLEIICPRLVPQKDARGETMALVLPGDPEHPVRTPRCQGASRFVLRGERFVPEGAP